LISEFASQVPRVLSGPAVYFNSEIIIFFGIMELDTYLYGAYSREKKGVDWGKSDNNFPFFTNNVNPKNVLCCKHMKCPLLAEEG
jgi:hypothetical protein